MILKIKSRKFNQEIVFSRPGKSYIYVDLNGGAGTNGDQICVGGYLTGSTIAYHGDDQDEFNKICRRWWKQHVASAETDDID